MSSLGRARGAGMRAQGRNHGLGGTPGAIDLDVVPSRASGGCGI
ncbi:hypothetical protein [Variovorax guangxiensis]|nr:hypothetical protein [Variovorax guangxiensis]MDR6860972.1 hypothetical protein [Variovorax guangxiensis]